MNKRVSVFTACAAGLGMFLLGGFISWNIVRVQNDPGKLMARTAHHPNELELLEQEQTQASLQQHEKR